MDAPTTLTSQTLLGVLVMLPAEGLGADRRVALHPAVMGSEGFPSCQERSGWLVQVLVQVCNLM